MNGFTMMPDEILEKLGVLPAMIYGMVYRFCQMDSGTCTASQEKIAKRLGLSRASVNRHLERLVKAGYLEADKKRGIGTIYKLTCNLELQDVSTKVTPTCNLELHKESLLRDTLRNIIEEKWEFQEMVERVIGLPMCQADIQTLQEWEKAKVVEDDLCSALQWRQDNGKKPVKTISQLNGGVMASRNKRVQGNAAKPGKSTRDHEALNWVTE